MTDSSSSPKGDSPFSAALTAIVKELKGNPALLFSLGIAILLVAAGALAFENLRLILVGLLVLAVLGLAVWVFVTMRKQGQERNARPAKATTGDVEVEGARVKKTLKTGPIEDANASGDLQTGSIKIKNGSIIDGTIETGGIKSGNRGKKS